MKPTSSTCSVCQKPVPLDRFGRARQYHAECRNQWRSARMKNNQHRKGKYKQKPYTEGEKDRQKNDAYSKLDPATIRQVAIAYWGEFARFSYWCYDQLNPLCFENRIQTPLIQFCRVMPYGSCIGLSHVSDIDRPVIDLFTSLWTKNRFPRVAVLGTIAHELLHFYCHLVWRERGGCRYTTSHNNEIWIQSVLDLSPILNVSMKTISSPYESWPHSGWSMRKIRKMEEQLDGYALPFGGER